LQGTYSYILQDETGQIANTHSVSAGLDYAAVGPEHAALKENGRAKYVCASDGEAVAACVSLAQTEGIIPALESAHAIAHLRLVVGKMRRSDVVIVNVSGRGDKDMGILVDELGKVVPPRSVVRQMKDWDAHEGNSQVGRELRIGYYNPNDGLDCVWLVDENGRYFETTNQRSIGDVFEVLQRSDETDVFGQYREPLESRRRQI
jgi:hypothetical protein